MTTERQTTNSQQEHRARDIFDDLEALKVDEQDLLQTTTTSTREMLRKPRSDEWFRVSSEPQHKPQTFLVYENSARKSYLVVPSVAKNPVIAEIAKKKVIYVAINRAGEVFLSMVGAGDDSWSSSARIGHHHAQSQWIRLVTNRTAGTYDVRNQSEYTEVPDFPDTSYNDLLRMAFGSNVIDSLDHQVACDLLGKRAPVHH